MRKLKRSNFYAISKAVRMHKPHIYRKQNGFYGFFVEVPRTRLQFQLYNATSDYVAKLNGKIRRGVL